MREKNVKIAAEMTERLKRNLDQMTEAQKKQYAQKLKETYEEIQIMVIGTLLAYYAPVTHRIYQSSMSPEEKKSLQDSVMKRQWIEKARAKEVIKDSLRMGHTETFFTSWENELLITREDLLSKVVQDA